MTSRQMVCQWYGYRVHDADDRVVRRGWFRGAAKKAERSGSPSLPTGLPRGCKLIVEAMWPGEVAASIMANTVEDTPQAAYGLMERHAHIEVDHVNWKHWRLKPTGQPPHPAPAKTQRPSRE